MPCRRVVRIHEFYVFLVHQDKTSVESFLHKRKTNLPTLKCTDRHRWGWWPSALLFTEAAELNAQLRLGIFSNSDWSASNCVNASLLINSPHVTRKNLRAHRCSLLLWMGLALETTGQKTKTQQTGCDVKRPFSQLCCLCIQNSPDYQFISSLWDVQGLRALSWLASTTFCC